ncbi:MAG: hypothetical protein NTU44_19955 [Bacteroidetes bacterium]|nr:hypothetical protein [Bacteroidota bacterium]
MKEKEWYSFQVGNEISLPDGSHYFALTGPSGTKHLLPFEPYMAYGFIKGDKILCRVDKINCSGRIFLEPSHPFYKEGDEYEFSVLRNEIRTDVFGEKEFDWIVKDVFDNEIFMPIEEAFFQPVPEKINARVIRIKKGEILLRSAFSKQYIRQLKKGNWYSFTILSETKQENEKTFWILEDSFSGKHLLRKKHFDAYSLEIGKVVRCKAVKWNEAGHFLLEPAHPVYEEEKEYTFRVVPSKMNIPENEPDTNLDVTDIFGNEIRVSLTKANRLRGTENECLVLKVKEMKKGKPVLIWPD